MKIRSLIFSDAIKDKLAVIDDRGEITFGELAGRAKAVRLAVGADGGRNIGIFLPDGADFIAALFGVISAGLVAFPLGMRLTAFELAPLLVKAEVRTVVTDAAHARFFDGLNVRVVPADALGECREELPIIGNEDDTTVLLGTSGTTGNAKIVMLSARNLAASAQCFASRMDYSACPAGTVRYLLGTPYSSSYGLMIIFVTACLALPLVVADDLCTLGAFYKAVARHRVTHYEGGTSIALLMAQTAGRALPCDIGSLRFVGFGGSKISEETFRGLIDAYPGIEFFTGYGMTEAGPLIARPSKVNLPGKLGSVGTAIDGETVLIATADGLTNAPYVRGEIVVKGDNVMQGYYGNDEETRKILRNGYLHTGDVGQLDEDGFLYICGRQKNVIIVRGFNVYAEEVEACIMQSKLAADCAVYGESDLSGQETVCADYLPARPDVTDDEIRAYCAARLAPFKQPRKIRAVAALAKTATGKNKKRGGGA